LPREHGIRDNQHFSLATGIETLAQRFKESGYRTGAVISGAPLRRAYGLDRGFDAYDDSGLGIEGDNAVTPSSRPANVATEMALAWLRSQPAGAPVLLWVHYYDPHWPYTPPQPYRDRYAANPYAGEIAFVDSQLGRLVEAIRGDRVREWIVAATGDHGEGLGDHGELTHGILLYGSTVDVPFILWSGRGVGSPGPGPFSLIDVAPTLCGLAHVSPAFGDGRSILGPGESVRWLAAESAYPALGHGLSPAVRLRRESTVYLDQGSDEIYDLDDDPGESRNLAGSPQARDFVRLASVARERIFGDRMEAEIFGGNLALSGRGLDALKGLGYITTTARGPRALRRVDLRRFAAELSNFQEARELFSARRFDDALGEYDAFIAAYPDSSLAHQERGQVLRSMGRLDDAEKAFARAMALDPRDPISALALGNIALAKEDFGRAEAFFKTSIDDEEGQPEAHLNLGLLYLYKLGRPADAKPHLLRFLELSPNDSEAAEIRRLADGIPTRHNP
jgi:arylsulfatase A-like enzyme/regulator of sirC expression with transglutaminase-like and TPR domain